MRKDMSKADRFPAIKSQAQIDWESASTLTRAYYSSGTHPAANFARRAFTVLGFN